MRDLKRSETLGLMTLMIGVTGVIGWGAVRKPLSNVPDGIILREAVALPPVVAPSPSPSPSPALPPSHEIVVHVTGAVKTPGVYHLSLGARGEDALKAAGGPTDQTDLETINLAALLEDGVRLRFPTRQEQPTLPAEPAEFASKALLPDAPKPTPKPNGPMASKAGAQGSKPGKLTTPGQGTVNINTAQAEELQRLSGIGPAMAERILEYRQANGGFQTPEDLMQVSGIGPKKFAKMQPFVRVR